jgi:signal transduction histidine kinase
MRGCRLHAILALSDMLTQDAAALPTASVKMVKIIQSSGQQLASLVNDILDAAAIQAGALVLKNDVVQLHLLVGGVLDVVSPMSPGSVSMINAVSDDLPVLQVDSARLQQILTNLLSNAVKFTREGEIRVEAEMQGRGERVAISVSDTGRGISQEHLQVMMAVWVSWCCSTDTGWMGTTGRASGTHSGRSIRRSGGPG